MKVFSIGIEEDDAQWWDDRAKSEGRLRGEEIRYELKELRALIEKGFDIKRIRQICEKIEKEGV